VSGVLLTVAYDGGPFSGFAPQANARTVAGELLGALRMIDPRIQGVRGASRTDAGVHALGQRVAFDTEANVNTRGWVLGTSRHLPREIAVVRAARVAAGFTPRFENDGKRYVYRVACSAVRDPFLDGRVWLARTLDAARLVEAASVEAAAAIGEHDFAAFRSSGDARADTTRTIRALAAAVDPSDPRVVRVEVEGDAFLYNMVRILVGTLVDVAEGRLAPGAMARALASKDRRDAGRTAPAAGLCLERVFLHDEGRDAWPELADPRARDT
jgi:tRNA pseudouridine38-40 synthase